MDTHTLYATSFMLYHVMSSDMLKSEAAVEVLQSHDI